MNTIKDHYIIFPEQKLIIERLEGVLNLENLAKVKADQDNDPEFDPAFDLLTDIRLTEVSFSSEELKHYAEYLSTHPLTQEGRRFALLTATPMQVAIASLIQTKTRHLPQKMEIFSTLESAMAWLGIKDILQKDIEFILAETLV
jgi:hypothetical protein